MRLLCFGDSNTYGYDSRSYVGDRYPPESRWTDLLAQSTGWEVLNDGYNGRTIPAPVTAVRLSRADGLVVMLGTNDLLQGLSAAEAAVRMEHFLVPLLPAYSRILLIAPPPMKQGIWVTEERLLVESARLAEEYEALARRLGISFADAGQWGVELTFDGIHFTESGHRAFAAGIRAALERWEARSCSSG